MKTSLLRWTLTSCAAMLMLATANASTISATFTYNGTGTYTQGETALGNGSLTFTDGVLTAFSFSNVLKVGASTETYVYGLGDINFTTTTDSTPAATALSNLNFNLHTKSVNGSPDLFGPTLFNFAYSSASPGAGSTGGSGQQLSTFTNGLVTITAATATPEPSSIYLIGLAGAGLAAFRKLRRA